MRFHRHHQSKMPVWLRSWVQYHGVVWSWKSFVSLEWGRIRFEPLWLLWPFGGWWWHSRCLFFAGRECWESVTLIHQQWLECHQPTGWFGLQNRYYFYVRRWWFRRRGGCWWCVGLDSPGFGRWCRWFPDGLICQSQWYSFVPRRIWWFVGEPFQPEGRWRL